MMKILLIDSYPINSIGISCYLDTNLENEVQLRVQNLDSLLEGNHSFLPDVAIYGITQQDHSENINTVKKIKHVLDKSRLIIFDRSQDCQTSLDFFEAGVDGYLGKLSSLADLIDCISSVTGGRKYVDSKQLVNLINFQNNPSSKTALKKIKLTAREREIANYLIEGKTNSWISKEINRFPSTISTIKMKIFNKMQVRNVIDLREKMLNTNKPTG